MNIGAMNRRLEILRYTTISPDEGFGEKADYRPYKNVWTEMLKQRITPVAAQGDGQTVVVTQGFKVRPVDVRKGDKVVCADRKYDVVDVDTSDRSCYTLTCKVVIS